MSNFSEYLMKGIANKDVKEIRGALNGYIDSDPAFKTTKFDDAVRYVQSKGIQVFEEMDNDLPIPDGAYEESLFFEIRAGLQSNYSKERLDALKKVGRSCMKNAKVYSELGAAKTGSKISANGNVRRQTPKVDNVNAGGGSPKKVMRQQQEAKRAIAVKALVLVLVIVIIILVIIIMILIQSNKK